MGVEMTSMFVYCTVKAYSGESRIRVSYRIAHIHVCHIIPIDMTGVHQQ